MAVEVMILQADDAKRLDDVAAGVFDRAIDAAAATEFAADPRHHIAVAIDGGTVVGFASGVHYLHPDKPVPELFVNEVGVAESHRGRGIGKAVLTTLLRHGRELGCGQAWVLTGRRNTAARRLFETCGATEAPSDEVMYAFSLRTAPGVTK